MTRLWEASDKGGRFLFLVMVVFGTYNFWAAARDQNVGWLTVISVGVGVFCFMLAPVQLSLGRMRREGRGTNGKGE